MSSYSVRNSLCMLSVCLSFFIFVERETFPQNEFIATDRLYLLAYNQLRLIFILSGMLIRYSTYLYISIEQNDGNLRKVTVANDPKVKYLPAMKVQAYFRVPGTGTMHIPSKISMSYTVNMITGWTFDIFQSLNIFKLLKEWWKLQRKARRFHCNKHEIFKANSSFNLIVKVPFRVISINVYNSFIWFLLKNMLKDELGKMPPWIFKKFG